MFDKLENIAATQLAQDPNCFPHCNELRDPTLREELVQLGTFQRLPMQIMTQFDKLQLDRGEWIELTAPDLWGNGGYVSVSIWDVEDRGSYYRFRVSMTGVIDQRGQGIVKAHQTRAHRKWRLRWLGATLSKHLLTPEQKRLMHAKLEDNSLGVYFTSHPEAEDFIIQGQLCLQYSKAEQGRQGWSFYFKAPQEDQFMMPFMRSWELQSSGERTVQARTGRSVLSATAGSGLEEFYAAALEADRRAGILPGVIQHPVPRPLPQPVVVGAPAATEEPEADIPF